MLARTFTWVGPRRRADAYTGDRNRCEAGLREERSFASAQSLHLPGYREYTEHSMADDLFGVSGRMRAKPVVQPYQKPRPVRPQAWTRCPHDPPCHTRLWCESGTRDVRDLQQAKGYPVDEAIRRVKLGERA